MSRGIVGARRDEADLTWLPPDRAHALRFVAAHPTPGEFTTDHARVQIAMDADRGYGWMVLLDGVLASYVALDDPRHLEFEYTRWIADLVDAMPSGPIEALHLGGAACSLPVYVEATRPEADGPEKFERYPGLPGINWVSAYDLRYVSGGIPAHEGDAADDSRSTLWVRDRPARPLDHAALTAMADCFYPRAFRRRGGFVPAGTVTLTVHFLADAAEVAAHGTEHLLGTAFSRRFGRGYFDQTGELWSQDGRLLATSHQLVYFKA